MRKQPLTWPARLGLLLGLAIGVPALALLAATLWPGGDVAWMLLAANGSAWRGIATVTAVGALAALGGGAILGRRRPRRALAMRAGALVVVVLGVVAAWQWRAGIEATTITFASAGTTLHGTLLRPRGAAPVPVVVIVHGSPRLAREFYAVWGRRLVRGGMAVFVYDKRGTGESGGVVPDDNGTAAYLRQLGADAAAAVEAVATQPGIDARRIGVLGMSQGGWTVPLAVAQAPRVWRYALLSGPVVRVDEENAFSAAAEGRNGDATADAQAIAAGEAAMANAGGGGFDPAPVIAALPQEGRWLFGARDRSVPVAASVRRLEALAARGRPVSYRVLPQADHVLFDRRASVPRFEPRVFVELQAWFAAKRTNPTGR
jgi:dienelactone hydrolase